MNIQPETICKSAMDRAIWALGEDDPSFLVLNGLEIDGYKLLQTEKKDVGYVILGLLASIRGNEQEVDICFSCAREISDDFAFVEGNYISALYRLRLYQKATSVTKQVFIDYQDNLNLLSFFVDSMISLGLYVHARKVFIKLEAANMYISPEYEGLVSFYENGLVSEFHLNEIIVRSFDIAVNEFGLMPESCRLNYGLNEDGGYEEYAFLNITVNDSVGIEQVMLCDYRISESSLEYELENDIDLSRYVFGCEYIGNING